MRRRGRSAPGTAGTSRRPPDWSTTAPFPGTSARRGRRLSVRPPATVQGMRALALWAVLFAAYAATLAIDAGAAGRYIGDEPRHLLLAESIVSDGDIDL